MFSREAANDRRIGVYVCHCGTNIASTVNVKEVAESAASLRGVVVARDYMFMCSDPGQELIKKDIRQYGLNRVVVASCSPLLHERTFRRVCRDAGLNPYLFEMANIREHCSWVHHYGATEKARGLVRAAVMRVYYHEPLKTMEVPINPSALIVGGGIAGIQAALDIANAGYKVYLVEREPSVGGHMIQLDKTFPTLDCSACILTPKMSDVGSHPNIELLTYSEVEGISGYIGNFKVKVKKKARYVDKSKCTGCSLCFQSCPVTLKSEFNMGLADRKAIYIPFPQAVPNKATIDKREERPCKAACMGACPLHQNVLGYVKLIAQGKGSEAYSLIRATNPLPATCGRVCYAPCEKACNRGQIDEPIAIRDLKRYADEVNTVEPAIPQITPTGKRVAVVGSGPAGLAAANQLILDGHEVTIFEALPEPGGMLRYGIPEYRLPKEVLRKDIDYIRRLGVEIRTGVRVGQDISLSDIRRDYQAVFIGAGAHGEMKLGAEGEDLPEVMQGLGFLRAVNLGEKVKVGKRVAVIGGGNTAVDCARTAKRFGAEDVTIVYRRSIADMPASAEEIAAAEEEGINIEPLAAPVCFYSEENGKLSGMQCIRMTLGEPDAGGRPRPVPLPGSEYTIPADTVIAAVGQVPDIEFVQELALSLTIRGTIDIDPRTGATNVAGVFAGGDVVTGPAFVVDAIAAGKRAARSINRYLNGKPLEVEEEQRKPERLSSEQIETLRERFPSRERVKTSEKAAEERIGDFQEVVSPYTPIEAVAEAARCLAGQIEGCIECRECEKHCEAKAIDYDMPTETLDVEVGSVILATGYDDFDPGVITQYGYNKYDNVITGLEFERLSNATGPTHGQILLKNGQPPQSVAIIHCVGSRDKNYHAYCSRVCCMYGLKFAHLIKEKTNAEVYQMYIDMRCFGEGYEEFYERVGTRDGVRFIRGKASKVTDRALTEDEKGKLVVSVEDTLLGSLIRVPVDMVVLCNALEPRKDAAAVGKLFSINRRADGFFMERHVKLDPIATMTDGVFIAGCCESPKDIPDTVAQAKAAASEVLSLLVRGKVETEPITAIVDEEVCSSCGLCEKVCPYGALSLAGPRATMKVSQALCKGCGACASVCPSSAISLSHFTPRQILEQVEALTY